MMDKANRIAICSVRLDKELSRCLGIRSSADVPA